MNVFILSPVGSTAQRKGYQIIELKIGELKIADGSYGSLRQLPHPPRGATSHRRLLRRCEKGREASPRGTPGGPELTVEGSA